MTTIKTRQSAFQPRWEWLNGNRLRRLRFNKTRVRRRASLTNMSRRLLRAWLHLQHREIFSQSTFRQRASISIEGSMRHIANRRGSRGVTGTATRFAIGDACHETDLVDHVVVPVVQTVEPSTFDGICGEVWHDLTYRKRAFSKEFCSR